MSTESVADILYGRVLTNSKVTIQGWIRTRRDSKIGISFLTVYDGSCFFPLQVVVKHTLYNYKNDILRLTSGCSVIITGQVIKSFSNNQCYEIQASKVKILGWIEKPDTYPISAKYHSVEYLRKVAHLRPRTNLIGAVARVRHTLAQVIHRFMNEQGFFWISTPLITTSNTEGAGEMFRVTTLDLEKLSSTSDCKINYSSDFFGKKTFLTVSGQLNGESYACALSKIYTFGPTFRAEKSNTIHHLAEFWMIEPEIAFASLEDIIDFAELLLKHVFKAILVERADDMQFFIEHVDKDIINRLKYFINEDFAQINYTEAINILKKCNQSFENPVSWGIDLSSEHEIYLTDKYFKVPVVVKNYPNKLKAFYVRINDDEKTVAAMDILVPGIGEIIGGSQREERLTQLDNRLTEMGLDKDDYWWYRDLRRYGTVPHSGFGLGFERLIMCVTGIQNIRDVIPFPRSSRNATF